MRRYLLIAGLCLAASCASYAKEAEFDGPVRTTAPSQADAARVMAYARDLRKEKGCEAAAPAYRVIAAMGEGFETAQHELGECLLSMQGARPEETALFRKEGLFWLERAAYAGNARAQRALALLYGAGDNAARAPAEALKWALVYQKNPDADLYGYQSLPPTYVPGLRKDLGDAAIADAEAFAKGFSPIRLGVYSGPPRPKRTERSEGAMRARPKDRP
ncbi:MAG: hypothetical protein AB7P23_02695 [Amphiplicatus sp.]